MTQNPNILFAALTLLGLLILYPVTPHFFKNFQKLSATFGAILMHVGGYGFLWLHQVPVLTVSLILVEGGIFLIIDPLYLSRAGQVRKLVLIVGQILMAIGRAINLSYLAGFPY